MSQLVRIEAFLQTHCEQNECDGHQNHENESLILEHNLVRSIGFGHGSFTESIKQESVSAPATERKEVLER